MSDINKSIRLVNFEGESMGLSVEEAMSKRHNSWKGWKCSAGAENIFIDADGHIHVAACKVGGKKGNIYYNHWELDGGWITCPATWCMCGQDMQLRKVRDPSFYPYMNRQGLETVDHLRRADWVVPFHYHTFEAFPRFVTWDLGRRCNFSCSYCHPLISNKTDPHRSEQDLMRGIRLVEKNFIKNHKAKWIFTGGEPTINPAFLNIVKYLHAEGHALHTQTNGSRSADYHRELIRYSFIGISVHLEFVEIDRLLKTIAAIIDEKESDIDVAKHWFGVRIMVGPGFYEQALDLKEKALEIPFFEKYGTISMSPIYENNVNQKIDFTHHGRMLSYAPEEYKNILTHA